jgi:mevalonate kinase
MSSETFKSKILLFGEYSLIKGGRALAIPFDKYQGSLKFDLLKKDEFLDFHNYLSHSSILSDLLDLEALYTDIKDGLYFSSNIPQGMGVGSSGALCAAIYKKYLKGAYDLDKKGLSTLMDHMSLMESYYHGNSSGLDPLVSLIDRTLVVQNRNQLSLPQPLVCSNLYLFNTGHSRKTSPFVMHYLEMCEKAKFEKENKELFEINENLINSYLADDLESIDYWFYKLSKWQYLHFSKMIHESVSQLWLEGLESKKYFFKLCGAGGGGHYIIYTKDFEALEFKNKLLAL